MRKALVTLLSIALIGGAIAAPAAQAKKAKKVKKIERTVTMTYGNPAIGTFGTGGCLGCPSTANATNEVFVSGEVTDDVSPIGYVELSWDTNGDGTDDDGVVICGKTDKPVAIPGGVTLDAFPWALPSPACVGASTSGTIKLTFSNLP